MVVVKSLINSRKQVLILNVVRLSVYDCFSFIFDNICIEKTWVRKKKKKKKKKRRRNFSPLRT